MKLVLVAVGHKPPAWAEAAFAEYARRFPPELALELHRVKAEPRDGRPPAALMTGEAERIAARIRSAAPHGARRVALDERGDRLTTAQLADRLAAWQRDGRDVAFVVGGADGLDAGFKSSCEERLRLSDLTLPHAFVPPLLAEALYRAWSMSAGHPYHRA